MQDEVFIKYTFKRKVDGHIWEQKVPIECLEGNGDKPLIHSDSWQEDWELLGRVVEVKKEISLDPSKNQTQEISIVLYRKNWITIMGCIDNSIKNIKENRAAIEAAYSNIGYAVTGAKAAISQIELGVVELNDLQAIIYNNLIDNAL